MPVISIIYIFMIKRKKAPGRGGGLRPGRRELWELTAARCPLEAADPRPRPGPPVPRGHPWRGGRQEDVLP